MQLGSQRVAVYLADEQHDVPRRGQHAVQRAEVIAGQRLVALVAGGMADEIDQQPEILLIPEGALALPRLPLPRPGAQPLAEATPESRLLRGEVDAQ